MKNLKTALESYIKDSFQENEINNLSNYHKKISKEFRWYVAKQLLNNLSFNVFCNAENLPNKWGNNSFSEENRNGIENIIKTYTYKNTNWGHKRNIHPGNNSYYSSRITTTSHPAGKWVSSDYYSDYMLLFNRNSKEIIFNVPNNNKNIKLDLKYTKYPLYEL